MALGQQAVNEVIALGILRRYMYSFKQYYANL
jgi:hypothetical protein